MLIIHLHVAKLDESSGKAKATPGHCLTCKHSRLYFEMDEHMQPNMHEHSNASALCSVWCMLLLLDHACNHALTRVHVQLHVRPHVGFRRARSCICADKSWAQVQNHILVKGTLLQSVTEYNMIIHYIGHYMPVDYATRSLIMPLSVGIKEHAMCAPLTDKPCDMSTRRHRLALQHLATYTWRSAILPWDKLLKRALSSRTSLRR